MSYSYYIWHTVNANTVLRYFLNTNFVIISDALAGLHYVQLLIGQLLSHVANQHYDYPYINMGIIIMAILNLIALLNVHDPPYYRLKLKKQTNALDFKLKIHDNSRSTICNNIYRVRILRIDRYTLTDRHI